MDPMNSCSVYMQKVSKNLDNFNQINTQGSCFVVVVVVVLFVLVLIVAVVVVLVLVVVIAIVVVDPET